MAEPTHAPISLPTPRPAWRGWLWFLLLATGLVGACCGGVVVYPALSRTIPAEISEYPLPHHVPKYPGGVSLRFAMVHDVMHERFPRHGKAFYEERNRQVRKALEEEKAKQTAGEKPSALYFGLLDDLGVGLDLLGQHEEAVALMRDKLKRQQELGLTGRDLYSTYANLGTFLILWQLSLGLADDPLAKTRMTEGLEWVHKSIAVNPQSHFGREIWQAVILEFLIAAMDRPDVLLEYDMIGDRLDAAVDPIARSAIADSFQYRHRYHRLAKSYLEAPEHSDDSEIAQIRACIATVGAEDGWRRAVKSSHREPVLFDEPALGIIGMWRLGGGANPHFALALAEIMLRVGQPYIAWCGYERAAQLGPHVWPEARIQQDFIDHCRRRQAAIEKHLPPDEVKDLRPRFDAELAFGRRYQDAYQAYEARRIAAGISIEDPRFYDAFDADHGVIASPIGPADRFLVNKGDHGPPSRARIAAALIFAGLFALSTAVCFWLARRTHERSPSSALPVSTRNSETA